MATGQIMPATGAQVIIAPAALLANAGVISTGMQIVSTGMLNSFYHARNSSGRLCTRKSISTDLALSKEFKESSAQL